MFDIKEDRPDYKSNPIFEVLCQITFDTILKIRSQEPSEFQDKIRKYFPKYQKGIVEDINLDSNFNNIMQRYVSHIHIFSDANNDWEVTLTDSFLAIKLNAKYNKFDDFQERLKVVLDAFDEEYSPNGYLRLGLRYRNLISQKSLPDIAIDDVKSVISENIAQELKNAKINALEKSFKKYFLFEHNNNKINLLCELLVVNGIFKNFRLDGDLAYIVDIDAYCDSGIEKNDIIGKLNEFSSSYIRNLFRYCISEDFHKSLSGR